MKPWRVTIHCSDSKNLQPVSVAEIRKWHLARGFDDIGYHMVIQPSGEVGRGRSLTVRGAHVKGHNEGNIGICLIGRDKFTTAQFKALRYKLDSLMLIYPISFSNIFCHYQFDPNKTCPNININDLLTWYITKDEAIISSYILEPV
jgi:hypothetical protein